MKFTNIINIYFKLNLWPKIGYINLVFPYAPNVAKHVKAIQIEEK